MSTATEKLAVTPPRRRLRVALALVAAMIGAAVAYYFFQAWATATDLDEAIAETDRLDPNWRFDDLMAERKPVPDERNAALVLVKLKPAMARQGMFLTTAEENLFQGLRTPAQLNVAQEAALRRAFGALPAGFLDDLRSIKDRPEGRLPIPPGSAADRINAVIDSVQLTRQAMHVLQNDVSLRAQQNDQRGALESWRALLNTAASSGDEPMLIAMLVRCAGEAIATHSLERALAQGVPPEDELKAVQDAITREIDTPLVYIALRGERAFVFQSIQDMRDGKDGSKVPITGTLSKWDQVMTMAPGFLARNQAAGLRTMNEFVEAAKLPTEQQEEAMARAEAAQKRAPALVASLYAGINKTMHAHRRTQALLRSAQVAVAAERYRQQHGFWPATPEALVKAGLLKAVPADPYDGKLMRMRRLADGLLVYSVGPDLTDNGGNLDRNNPIAPGTDLGFQLWDVGHRRQPSPPPLKIEE